MEGKAIREYFSKRPDAIVGAIGELVDIESPSLDIARSQDAADLIVNRALETGADLQIERVSAAGYGDHLVIRAFPSPEKPYLLIGHTDTVHPVGTKAQNPTRIEDDKFFGCGIFDMKANIVLMLEALRFFTETGTRPARPVTIVLSCDEEIGSKTGRAIIEKEAEGSAACFVFEPSAAGRVKTGRKGTGMYTVKTHGVPAHAGLEPEKGVNAILELAYQIQALQALNAPDAGTTVNVCTAKGGTTSNVIPEHAECSADVRFTSMAEAARIDKAIKALKPVDERVSLTITGDSNRPPLERTEAVVRLFHKAKDLAAGFGYELGETQVGGASDGNFVAALGIPVLDGLGVKGDGAHTLTEHILVSDIPDRAALITCLLSSTE